MKEYTLTRYRRMLAVNRYYKITKFYSFLKDTSIKAALSFLIIGLVLFVLEYFFLDFEVLIQKMVDTFSAPAIMVVFLISETLLGLIPPEIFIAWSAKTSHPLFLLFLLATMSYAGGVIAYGLGKLLVKVPSVRNYLETKIAVHIVNLRKWGGFFVFVGAMLPVPHSMVSTACGLIGYNFRHYLIWALFRYLRFAIFALVIFRVF